MHRRRLGLNLVIRLPIRASTDHIHAYDLDPLNDRDLQDRLVFVAVQYEFKKILSCFLHRLVAGGSAPLGTRLILGGQEKNKRAAAFNSWKIEFQRIASFAFSNHTTLVGAAGTEHR